MPTAIEIVTAFCADFTERRERFQRADGSEIGAAMVMGIFEIEGDHIVAWRDYFDVRNAEKWASR
jgi:limonene-1,2-epoxide hydrolase